MIAFKGLLSYTCLPAQACASSTCRPRRSLVAKCETKNEYTYGPLGGTITSMRTGSVFRARIILRRLRIIGPRLDAASGILGPLPATIPTNKWPRPCMVQEMEFS